MDNLNIGGAHSKNNFVTEQDKCLDIHVGKRNGKSIKKSKSLKTFVGNIFKKIEASIKGKSINTRTVKSHASVPNNLCFNKAAKPPQSNTSPTSSYQSSQKASYPANNISKKTDIHINVKNKLTLLHEGKSILLDLSALNDIKTELKKMPFGSNKRRSTGMMMRLEKNNIKERVSQFNQKAKDTNHQSMCLNMYDIELGLVNKGNKFFENNDDLKQFLGK